MAEINFPLKVYSVNGGATYFGTEDHWPQGGDSLPATDKLKLDEREANAQVEKIKADCEYCPLRLDCRQSVRVGTRGKGTGSWVTVSTRTHLTKAQFLLKNPPCAVKYGATIS